MKEINFKNGKSLKVADKVAKVICDAIMTNKIDKKKTCFYRVSRGSRDLVMVNVKEIVFVK